MANKSPRKKSGSPTSPARRAHLALVPGAVVASVLAGAGAWWALSGSDPATAAPGEVVVHKSPSCGCCAAWVDHMRDAGFTVTVNDTADMDAVKRRHEVPRPMGSCHTALVDGYVIEGHVPAADVKRFLAERPQAAGLAVPGMPIGSPGMEQGGYRERYDVLMFGSGGATVFARH